MAKKPRPTQARSSISKSVKTNETLRIRKISNGFIVAKTTETKTGFKDTETFTPKKPNIKIT